MDLFKELTPEEKQTNRIKGSLAAIVEDARIRNGYTVEQLSAKTGIPVLTIKSIENTEYNITVAQMVILLNVLDINYDLCLQDRVHITNKGEN